MRRPWTARLRFVVLIITIGFASSLALSGCGSGGGGSPAEPAPSGHDAAKSSMEYSRQHIAESKTASKARRKVP
jgi:hypothetical protein